MPMHDLFAISLGIVITFGILVVAVVERRKDARGYLPKQTRKSWEAHRND